jgi:hypothetical protein
MTHLGRLRRGLSSTGAAVRSRDGSRRRSGSTESARTQHLRQHGCDVDGLDTELRKTSRSTPGDIVPFHQDYLVDREWRLGQQRGGFCQPMPERKRHRHQGTAFALMGENEFQQIPVRVDARPAQLEDLGLRPFQSPFDRFGNIADVDRLQPGLPTAKERNSR